MAVGKYEAAFKARCKETGLPYYPPGEPSASTGRVGEALAGPAVTVQTREAYECGFKAFCEKHGFGYHEINEGIAEPKARPASVAPAPVRKGAADLVTVREARPMAVHQAGKLGTGLNPWTQIQEIEAQCGHAHLSEAEAAICARAQGADWAACLTGSDGLLRVCD